jgi:hypothetical protein
MSDQDELISITEAAKRLGTHRNTIVGRVNRGIYTTEQGHGPKGAQTYIHVSSLNNTTAPPTLHMDPSGAMTPAKRQASPAAILSVLSPILEQMRADAAENGMLKERVRTLEDQIRSYQQAARDRADMSRPWWRKLFRP